MLNKMKWNGHTNLELKLTFVIRFLEEKRNHLLTDMNLQGVGEGNVDHRPWQVESIDKALEILRREA